MPTAVDDDRTVDPFSDERNPGDAHYRQRVGNGTKDKPVDDNYVSKGLQDLEKHANGDNSASKDSEKKSQLAKRFDQFKESKWGKRLGKAAKSKWIVGAGIGGSALATLIIILFIMISAFKIPHLVENITTYQFARIFQRMQAQNERSISAKIATSIGSNERIAQVKERYGKYTAPLEKWSPNKQIANLGTKNGIEFVYSGDKISAVKLADGSTIKPQPTFLKGLIPGYRFYQGQKFSQQFVSELQVALRTNEVGPVVRWEVSRKLRSQLGISLVAWKAGQYKGMSREEVRIKVEQETIKRTTTPSSATPKTGPLKDAKEELTKVNEELTTNDDLTKELIDNDGVTEKEISTLRNAVSSNAFQTGLQWLNGFYAVATPVCIVYDGSMNEAGPTIDANSAAQIKFANLLATTGDQIKNGETVNGDIAGAYADKFEGQGSAALARSSGQAVDTTKSSLQAQATAGGNFTFFNVLMGGGDVASLANSIANKACPTLTSPEFAVTGATISVLSIPFTGGGSAGVQKATTSVISRVTKKVIEAFALKNIRETASRTGRLIADTVKSGVKIAGATVIAKYIVASQAGSLNNGAAQGPEAVDMADSGMNLMANEVMRRQLYGRPLSDQEVAAASAETMQHVAQQNRQKSAFERYASISNPSSLISNLGYSLSSTLTVKNLASVAHGFKQSINPFGASNKILASINPSVGAATIEANSITHGNIQWGWNAEEQRLLRDNPDYSWLENQRILDERGISSEIENEYGKCFSEETTIGTLLQEGDIVLDDNGKVVDTPDAACSPINLGINNPRFGDGVFRWRVMKADVNDVNESINQQEITASASDDSMSAQDTSFRIASFNVLHSADEPDEIWKKRLKLSMDTLLDADNGGSNPVDIAGLQEMRPNQIKSFADGDFGASAYDFYPKATSGSEYSSNIIIWNKEKYEQLPYSTPGIDYEYFDANLMAPLVKLQNKETGQQFFVLNTHDPADARGDASFKRFLNANRYAQRLRNLSAEGLPIFFTGDFNNRYSVISSDQNEPYQQKRYNLTYCILTQDGTRQNTINTKLWDAYDAAKDAEGECPSATNAPNPNVVDHIFMSRTVRADSYKAVEGGRNKNGSDHYTIIADITIPGTGSNTGAGSTFSIGTYNLPARAGSQNFQKAVTNMKSNNVDVIGMQELSQKSNYFYIKNNMKSDNNPDKQYGIVPDKTNDELIARQGSNSQAILYRKSKFKLIKYETFAYPRYASDNAAGSGGEEFIKGHSNAPIVWLEDKETGQMIIVINVHNVAYAGNAERRYKANQVFLKQIDKLKKSDPGVPIFLTGDFNEGTGVRSDPKRNMTYQLNHNNLLYCMLAKDKIMNSIETLSQNKAMQCPNPSIGGVDYIYATPEVKVAQGSVKRIDGAQSGSDHPFIYGTVEVPGNGSGGGGSGGKGWTWPLAKNDWNGPFGYNVWGSCRVKCRHGGIDLSGTAGDKVLAAHEGVVTSAGYVILTRGACKFQVIIKAAGTPYWHAYQHLGSMTVQKGDVVKAGQVIGTVDKEGPTGDCGSGANLHFSIEKQASVSSYSGGSGVSCNIDNADCAKNMTSVPPLCLLPNDGRNYGNYVPKDQIIGSTYCKALVGGS